MNSIEELLREEIESELNGLDELELGSDSYKTTLDGLVKLTDRLVEIHKFEADKEEKVEKKEEAKAKAELEREQFEETKAQAKIEQDFKTKQLEEEKKDRFIKNCIAVAGIVLPVAVTIWGTKRSFEFEKEGTITTIMGRGFINKLIPKK